MSEVALGSAAGALCVAFGALFYDYRGRWGNVVRVLLTSLCISALVGVIAGAILQALQAVARRGGGLEVRPKTLSGGSMHRIRHKM